METIDALAEAINEFEGLKILKIKYANKYF
jgi:hypothetical protein